MAQQDALPLAFKKDFTKPMSIPPDGIAAAVAVMQSGRLFRYSATSAHDSEVYTANMFAAQMKRSHMSHD